GSGPRSGSSGSAQPAPSRSSPSSSAGSSAVSYPTSGGTWLVTSCVATGPVCPVECGRAEVDMDWSFHATGVTKVYAEGRVRANDGITLRVEPGEVYGLLGPNGAG